MARSRGNRIWPCETNIRHPYLATLLPKVLFPHAAATPTLDAEAETLTLKLPSELTVGESTLNIDYTGTLNGQMRGFYRSKYNPPDNPQEDRYAGVTQFEAADARRALPCWDEPALKATFDVVLVVPKDRVGLSNMVCWTSGG